MALSYLPGRYALYSLNAYALECEKNFRAREYLEVATLGAAGSQFIVILPVFRRQF
jgi:hypothetical protein